jgi:hypothetical protein
MRSRDNWGKRERVSPGGHRHYGPRRRRIKATPVQGYLVVTPHTETCLCSDCAQAEARKRNGEG